MHATKASSQTAISCSYFQPEVEDAGSLLRGLRCGLLPPPRSCFTGGPPAATVWQRTGAQTRSIEGAGAQKVP